MADIKGLSGANSDCKATLEKATATIRSLIKERNAALTAADPTLVKAMQEETEIELQANSLRGDIEQARKDTEAAIAEAGNIPAISPKAAAAKYPKTLGDSTNANRPNVVVNNVQEENAARFKQFNVQILPAPAPVA